MPNRLAIAPQSKKYKTMQLLAAAERALRGKASLGGDQLKDIRNFLFLQYDSPLGSAVHATPLYEAMKRAMPEAHITVAASSMAASVIRHNPWVDRWVIAPDPSGNFWAAVAAVRQLYRNLPEGPVCIVTTTGNQRPILALMAMLVGPAMRVGYTLALPLYHVALDFRADRPQIENNLEILRVLGHAAGLPKIMLEPRVFFRREDAEAATRLLTGIAALRSIQIPQEKPRIAVVSQCSGLQPKSWSEERFRVVIAALQEATKVTPIFMGTASESEAIEKIRARLQQPGISLAGKTSIPELAAVLSQCDWILALDTGTFHVARAVGLPGVVLAPAWQNPVEWLPVGDTRYSILRAPVTMKMPGAEYEMEEISVDQVFQSTQAMMRVFPASLETRAERLERSVKMEDRRVSDAADCQA